MRSSNWSSIAPSLLCSILGICEETLSLPVTTPGSITSTLILMTLARWCAGSWTQLSIAAGSVSLDGSLALHFHEVDRNFHSQVVETDRRAMTRGGQAARP